MEVLYMALDALTGGSIYREPINTMQISGHQTNDNSTQDMGINITEIPVEIESSGSNKSSGDKEKGQNEKSTDKQIKDAINKANNTLKAKRTRCEFSYHEEIQRVSIKVVDEDTEEVVREIPPEEALKMVEKMWELAGMLIDEKR